MTGSKNQERKLMESYKKLRQPYRDELMTILQTLVTAQDIADREIEMAKKAKG